MSEPSPSPTRYHDLDALRGAAMLLGIVLHGILSFIEIPIWPAQDIHQEYSEGLGHVSNVIHGFRMPLFFLLSGFFTAMMYRRRGLRALLRHRALRILIPLAVGTLLVVPTITLLSAWGGRVKAERGERARTTETSTLISAARSGDAASLSSLLAEGADPNQRDRFGGVGISALDWAVMEGRTEAVRLLLEAGADAKARGNDKNTALHAAAFLGRTESVELLLEYGADMQARNKDGATPLQSAQSDWGMVSFITGLLGISVDRKEVEEGRLATIALLESHGATTPSAEDRPADSPGALTGLLALGAFIPVFHHLWFLHYLVWLIAIFLAVAWLLRKAGRSPFPAAFSTSPLRLLWLVPLAAIPQFFMRQSFGADTAAGLFVWPPKLLYYAVFFGTGALLYGKPDFDGRALRHWPLYLVAGAALYPIAAVLHGRTSEGDGVRLLYSLAASAFAWTLIFGTIGVFRRFLSGERPKLRYLSDASYWLYLAHLPVIIALQILVSDLTYPAWAKCLFVILVPTVVLLALYEFCVRYTWVGAILNGRKVREG